MQGISSKIHTLSFISKTLLKIGNLEDSVALAYYAMYHSLLALLFRVGIKCENHTAAILLLQEVFAISNENIMKAKTERVDKQYYIDFNINKQETEQAVSIAEEFIAILKEFTDKLNNTTIAEYQKVTEKIIK